MACTVVVSLVGRIEVVKFCDRLLYKSVIHRTLFDRSVSVLNHIFEGERGLNSQISGDECVKLLSYYQCGIRIENSLEFSLAKNRNPQEHFTIDTIPNYL